ncbi:MAG: glycosyltransferase [Candidatus Micrarchaeota archaeon]|nr:glycosyltransferase [Candidatus Micrarchaeota archaeon]
MGKEKILFICTSMPTRLGGVRRLYNNMLFFSKKYEIHFAKLTLDNAKAVAEIKMPSWINFVEVAPGKVPFDPEMACLVPPAWNEYRSAGGCEKKLQEYIDKNGIAIVFCHSITLSFALRGLKAKVKIADIVDSVLNYYKTKDNACPTITSKLLYFSQSALYRRLEKIIDRDYDLVLFCSEIDRRESLIPKNKTCLLDVIYISDLENEEKQGPKNTGARPIDVAIMGRWEHPPNRDGLARVAKQLGKINGNIRIIGPNLPQRLQLPPNVERVGFVDDIEDTLSNSKVCLVPVWYGPGLQNKVFDALKCGCIIVSTPHTRIQMEANGFRSESIIYTDDMAGAVNTALQNYGNEGAGGMYRIYSEWEKISRKNKMEYSQKLERILQSKGTDP